jgi:hypothetical protein
MATGELMSCEPYALLMRMVTDLCLMTLMEQLQITGDAGSPPMDMCPF